MKYSDFKDLFAYQKAFELAMRIFELTMKFPKEETYSLTDQIRRSSRSVSTTIAEAYQKRAYPKHFRSKMTDCVSENSETEVWLNFALHCKYITAEEYNFHNELNQEVRKLLTYMLNNPGKFGVSEE